MAVKKIISVLLAVLLLATVCTVAASASEQEDVSIVGITFESDGDVCEEAYQGGATENACSTGISWQIQQHSIPPVSCWSKTRRLPPTKLLFLPVYLTSN